MRLLILLIFMFAMKSFAGPITSGGGNAIVCRSFNGQIISAELLDLYEARVGNHLLPASSSGDAETDFVAAKIRGYKQFGVRLSQYFLDFVVKVAHDEYHDFARPVVFTQLKEHLPLLHDQGNMLAPPSGCQIEQLAIFNYAHPSGLPDIFRVDREIYEALDSNNRAALASHELNHRSARSLGELNSELTRGYVGYEFTDSPLPTVYQDIPRWVTPGGSELGFKIDYECHNVMKSNHSYHLSFFVLQIPNGKGTRLQFTIMGSRIMNTQTYIDLSDVQWVLREPTAEGQVAIVTEAGMDIKRRIPLQTVEQFGIELEVIYKTGEPVQFNIFHRNNPLTHTTLSFCIDRHKG